MFYRLSEQISFSIKFAIWIIFYYCYCIPETPVKPIFDQCSTYVETRFVVFTSKMFEKHLWKSDILSIEAGR